MSQRLPVTKTYKLFIGGKFPRTESGRTSVVEGTSGDVLAHVCRGSRKDLRNAVEIALKAQAGWGGATAYLRGQVVYRLAEMLEGKRAELADAIESAGGKDGEREVLASIDRLVTFAGWADKYAQVAGVANPVAGPYHNFTVPEPMGVVGVIAPDEPSLLGLVSLIAPSLAAGNAVVALASETNPIPSMVLAEALATSDVPGGVVNILTGLREELVPFYSSHREIDGVVAAGVSDEHRAALREGAAENLKRVTIVETDDWYSDERLVGPGTIDSVVEFKTIWHPSAT